MDDSRTSDTEKVSFNISVVDLGRADLLIEQGFYSSRTDVFRAAIRKLLDSHEGSVKEAVTRKLMVMGVVVYTRGVLEEMRKRGKVLEIQVVGVVAISNDVPVALALATIRSVKVFGVFRASPELKVALADRVR